MDNEKIGKFIKKLRKAKGLTQQQLGDLVGVGGKSVSKWERGINMPDVSIINEVSNVLDITSDELLKGEFDKNSTNREYIEKKKQKKSLILLFVFLILIFGFIILSILYFKNETYKYWLTTDKENFSVDGTIEYDKKEYKISVDRIYCELEECNNQYINSIKYSLSFNGTVLYMNGEEYSEYNKVTLNEYLYTKKILLINHYDEGIMTYSDMKNGINNISILIESNIGNELYEYIINLRIDDK